MVFLSTFLYKVKGVLLSRKFWAAVGSTLAILTSEIVSPESSVLAIAGIWVAYIFGTALEDGLAASGGAPRP